MCIESLKRSGIQNVAELIEGEAGVAVEYFGKACPSFVYQWPENVKMYK